jgi:hypothetical protein
LKSSLFKGWLLNLIGRRILLSIIWNEKTYRIGVNFMSFNNWEIIIILYNVSCVFIRVIAVYCMLLDIRVH